MRTLKARIVAGLIIFGAGAPYADAGVFELPERDAVVSIDLPDAWQVAAQRDTLRGTTPEGVDVRMVVVSPEAASDLMASLAEGDAKTGLIVDRASEDRDDRRIAAREAVDVSYRTGGKLPGRLRLVRMELVPGKVLVMRFFGTESALDATDDTIESVFTGLKVLDN